MNPTEITRFEHRLYAFTFIRAVWFYLPVLVHHIVAELREAGAEQPHAVAMSTLVIFSAGMLVAEYPSGVFADWAGRKRALALSCLLNAAGAAIYVVSSSLAALFVGQFIFGLSSAFRSGSDSALLYSYLERAGVPERYRVALARMRIASNCGIAAGCFAGGLLYAWWPTSVFIGTGLFSLAAFVCLAGIEEPIRSAVPANYYGVFRESLAEVRRSVPVRAILLLGGVGTTFFLFMFWTTQSYLVEIGLPVKNNGFVFGITPLLSAVGLLSMSWLAASRRRHGMAMGFLLLGIPLSLLVTAAAYRNGWFGLGAGVLITIAMGQTLFRNLAILRLQELVPDNVRASLSSLASWITSVLYVPVFPVGGALLDAWGVDGGYAAIAVLVLLPSVPLCILAHRSGVWRDESPGDSSAI